jgi:hypothetical protein
VRGTKITNGIILKIEKEFEREFFEVCNVFF